MKKFFKAVKYTLLIFVILVIAGGIYFRFAVLLDPPVVEDQSALEWIRKQKAPDFYTIGPNWLRKSDSGLWEMYVEGAPFERGVAMGKLQRELNHEQEIAFVTRLKEMVPSESYIRFLKYGIAWFNRDLEKYVDKEFTQEIYGFAEANGGEPDSFAFVGPKYQRKLNYHAAHDIGHALQNMDFVQCTSFGVWGEGSADSGLIIGRNFDFYVGDDFAKNKVIAFYNPKEGHKFMMVTWSGMTGVTSGMNMKGLTITLNSAKSPIPSASKTPVSILAREILQYAGNIQEAYDMARSKETFVTETFLIGSAVDGRAAIIEKTPGQTALYDPNDGRLICTNHLQSDAFSSDSLNLTHIKESASMYRWKRTEELLDANPMLSPASVADILRDQRGLKNLDIGMGNEKAINQLICHHSIIFQPEKLKVWVAQPPYQLGEYKAYDLNKVFGLSPILKENTEMYTDSLSIPQDPFYTGKEYASIVHYRMLSDIIKRMVDEKTNRNLSGPQMEAFIGLNPEFFETYELLGDYYTMKKEFDLARKSYQSALAREIPTLIERKRIEEKLVALS